MSDPELRLDGVEPARTIGVGTGPAADPAIDAADPAIDAADPAIDAADPATDAAERGVAGGGSAGSPHSTATVVGPRAVERARRRQHRGDLVRAGVRGVGQTLVT